MNKLLYEDVFLKAELANPPAIGGHILIKPQEQLFLLSELQNEEREHFFFTASYGATLLFELLKAHATNIIINENPKEQLTAHIITRFQEDGLNFLWQPIPVPNEELQAIGKQIKDKTDELIWKKNNKGKQPRESENKEIKLNNSSTADYNADDPENKNKPVYGIFNRVP
jgi:diadenosine tetraphosphate (Ap4A) HIT family hydrolase